MSRLSDRTLSENPEVASPGGNARGNLPKPEETPVLSAAASVFWTALLAEVWRRARLTGRSLAAAARWFWRHLKLTAQGMSRAGHAAYDRRRGNAGSLRGQAPFDLKQPVTVASDREQPHRPVRRRWRILTSAAIAVAAVVGLGSVLTAGVVIWAVRDMPLADILPALEEPHLAITTTDGDTLYSQGAYRAGYVPLSELPDVLIEAVIAVEDRRFYEHGGIDIRAIARAAMHNLRRGGIVSHGVV